MASVSLFRPAKAGRKRQQRRIDADTIEKGKGRKIGSSRCAYSRHPCDRPRRDGIEQDAVKVFVRKVGRADDHSIEYIFWRASSVLCREHFLRRDHRVAVNGHGVFHIPARSRRRRSPSRECRGRGPRGTRVRRASSIPRSSEKARPVGLRGKGRRRRYSRADQARTAAARS